MKGSRHCPNIEERCGITHPPRYGAHYVAHHQNSLPPDHAETALAAAIVARLGIKRRVDQVYGVPPLASDSRKKADIRLFTPSIFAGIVEAALLKRFRKDVHIAHAGYVIQMRSNAGSLCARYCGPW